MKDHSHIANEQEREQQMKTDAADEQSKQDGLTKQAADVAKAAESPNRVRQFVDGNGQVWNKRPDFTRLGGGYEQFEAGWINEALDDVRERMESARSRTAQAQDAVDKAEQRLIEASNRVNGAQTEVAKAKTIVERLPSWFESMEQRVASLREEVLLAFKTNQYDQFEVDRARSPESYYGNIAAVEEILRDRERITKHFNDKLAQAKKVLEEAQGEAEKIADELTAALEQL